MRNNSLSQVTLSEIETAILAILPESTPWDDGIRTEQTRQRANRDFVAKLSDPANIRALRVLESL